jgi:hypothetical protein
LSEKRNQNLDTKRREREGIEEVKIDSEESEEVKIESEEREAGRRAEEDRREGSGLTDRDRSSISTDVHTDKTRDRRTRKDRQPRTTDLTTRRIGLG